MLISILLQHLEWVCFVLFVCFCGVVVPSFTSLYIIHCITTANEINMQQPMDFLLLAGVSFGLYQRHKTDLIFQMWRNASLVIIALEKKKKKRFLGLVKASCEQHN